MSTSNSAYISHSAPSTISNATLPSSGAFTINGQSMVHNGNVQYTIGTVPTYDHDHLNLSVIIEIFEMCGGKVTDILLSTDRNNCNCVVEGIFEVGNLPDEIDDYITDIEKRYSNGVQTCKVIFKAHHVDLEAVHKRLYDESFHEQVKEALTDGQPV